MRKHHDEFEELRTLLAAVNICRLNAKRAKTVSYYYKIMIQDLHLSSIYMPNNATIEYQSGVALSLLAEQDNELINIQRFQKALEIEARAKLNALYLKTPAKQFLRWYEANVPEDI
jgi:hypothetical protein